MWTRHSSCQWTQSVFFWLTALAIVIASPRVWATSLPEPTILAEPGSSEPEEDGFIDPSQFDNLSLEELLNVVVTATKTATSVRNAPAVVTIIARQDVERFAFQSVAEALQGVVGIYIVDDHAIPNLGMTGVAGGAFSESGNIKLMIDGIAVPFRTTASNWLGPELIPMSAIERIEVVQGPTSSLYGADAYLGVVNIVTRDETETTGTVQLGSGVTGGGFPLYDADGFLSVDADELRVNVAGRFNLDDRSGLSLPPSSPAPQLGGSPRPDLESRHGQNLSGSAYSKATYTLSETTNVSVALHYSHLEREAEFAPIRQLTNLPGAAESSGTHYAMMSSGATVRLDWQASEDLDLMVRATGFYDRTFDNDSIEVGSSLYAVRRNYLSYGVDSNLEVQWTALESLRVVTGIEAVDNQDSQNPQRICKIDTPAFAVGDSLDEQSSASTEALHNIGAYAQSTWNGLDPYLSATGGLRFDWHSIYGPQLSGRLALVANPSERVFLRLIGASAFKAPAPLFLYGKPSRPGDIIGNLELEPQKIWSVQADAAYHSNKTMLRAGASYLSAQDVAMFIPSGLNTAAQNIATISGVSWNAELRHFPDTDTLFFLTYESNHYVRELNEVGYRADLFGDTNPIYPHWVVRMGGVVAIDAFDCRIAVQGRVVGPRNGSDSNVLLRGEQYELPTYAAVDVNLTSVDLHFFGGRPTQLGVAMKNLVSAGADAGFGGSDYPLPPTFFSLFVRQEL